VTAVVEHLATRRAAGLFDFSFMGLYEFSGLGALQSLQTRNLKEMQPDQIVYTLLLKDDDAVLIDATVWSLDADRFWLFTGRRGAYGGRDRSGEYAILALQGPASGRILAKLIGANAVRGLPYFHFLQKDNLIVARLGFSGELGYELLVHASDAPALRQKVLNAGRGDGLRECSWAAADSLRIESGYVLFDREVDGRANPRELGLERLVEEKRNFEVTRRLVGLEILDQHGGTDLPMANVTSECASPTLGKTLALGFANSSAGDLVRLPDGRTARVAPLPFYDPQRRRPRAAPLP
jgi:glycine cleavage system T protein (aminomethyltransferase)